MPHRVRQFFKVVPVLFTLATSSGCIEVIGDGGTAFDERNIRAVISEDSPIYYRDGKTRLGVFFDDEHREYVPFADLPKAWVVALVAAEDGRYWSHGGVDPKHIARAIFANLTSGGLVSGGSTLTQQTAKNIFYRPDRSLKSKWTELLNALRLEARYDKKQILEFYANQFHVSGNGRGLGIGARHFFDKDARELGLLECAFLAGLVKGPTNYDPFFSSDPARQEKARKRAHDRVGYVLRRIVAEDAANLRGPYTDAEVAALKTEASALLAKGYQLPFQQGVFRYDSNAVVDEVAHRLDDAPFAEVLKAAGITDPSTAGLEIVTTLDENIQRESIYSLWHHLTEVGTMLEAIDARGFALRGEKPPPPRSDLEVIRHAFYKARVAKHVEVKGKKFLEIDLGGATCTVDRAGVERVATAIHRGAKKNRDIRPSSAFIDQVRDALPVGTVVLASVRDFAAKNIAICDLEVRPKLQGSAVVLEDGQLRGLVGGNDNRNFNRAEAPRQMGSTWKTLIYHAAMELGWHPTDAIDNRLQAFPFGTVIYAPSSDHEPSPTVSLAWAGVHSENLASVWLLYHLVDRLDPAALQSLAEKLDVGPRANESAADYKKRLAASDIRLTEDRIPEAVFLQAKAEILATGRHHPADTVTLRGLLYGWHTESLRKKQPATGLTWREIVAQSGAALFPVDPTDLTMDPSFDPMVGPLHASTIRNIEAAIARIAPTVGTDPYAPPLVYQFQDVRVLTGIRYAIALAEQYGVRTDLRPGLPLPLGASEISLEEATMLYDGLTSGESWDFPGEASGVKVAATPAPTLMIAEIRDIDGNVLYRATPKARPVAQPNTAAMTADILRNVVRHGTGRRALEAVPNQGPPVPVGGKTGTTNDYKNVAFLGYVPHASNGGYRVGNGFTVGVYVGYDDNHPMQSGSIALAGANGALPAWIGIARGLAAAGRLGVPDGEPIGGEWPLLVPLGLLRHPVETQTGLAGEGGFTLGTPVPVFTPSATPESPPERPRLPLVLDRPRVRPQRELHPLPPPSGHGPPRENPRQRPWWRRRD